MKTEKTSFHHSEITSPAQFARTINAGAFAWPGGYPLFFITSDGEALSFDAAKKNARQVCAAIREGARDGWRVVGCAVNWEDSALFCADSGKRIESAYAEDDAQPDARAVQSVANADCEA